MQIDKKFWKNKKILITKHTSFKGGWLSFLFNFLGSKVYGYSLEPEVKYNFFIFFNFKKVF